LSLLGAAAKVTGVMPILVDGYNLAWTMRALEGRAGDPFVPADEVKRLVGFLGRYAAIAGEKVIVVFDGDAPRDASHAQPPRGVRIVHSGKRRRADDVLIDMVSEAGGGGQLTVVSSDREIRSKTRRAGAVSLASAEFRTAAVRAVVARAEEQRLAEPDAKQTGLGPGEVDVWMEILGLDGEEEATE